MRIAMWSGPRNLSTALMYSFGNRPDTAVWDEPFYAAYLHATGLSHPLAAEIMAAGDISAPRIAARCLGPIPDDKPIFYQKHMTHHMLPDFPLSWSEDVTNIFLIRHPDRVIASYHAKRENPTLEDIGFRQQAAIFEKLKGKGHSTIVIDSEDILMAPEASLRTLCEAINLPFTPEMLNWPKGGHSSDGPWAKHWYGSVWGTKGFAKGVSLPLALTPAGKNLAAKALPFYESLAALKLRIPDLS